MIENTRFINDLERVATVRADVANALGKIAEILSASESVAEARSGKLGLDSDIEDLQLASNNLKAGVFRLLILGDMIRGKSTFLNALIGEKLLPSDVNPCTALLTVLRYGSEKKVTVYFKAEKRPEKIDFATLALRYLVCNSKAKKVAKCPYSKD